jgi:putative transposase
MRRDSLVVGQVYHVFTRSIAEYKIFNNEREYSRIREVISYYQHEKPDIRFSEFIELESDAQRHKKESFSGKDKLVEIIAYCIMPTHVHLVLKQLRENGISTFIGNVLNSYTRYFNTKHKRKGPLWESRFKNVLVETDEYLLHLTRYIHLNPVTAALVNKPEDWDFSSYGEYLLNAPEASRLCSFESVINMKPGLYKGFVEDRIAYQRELAKIKALLLD